MIAVIFEVVPAPGRRDAYLGKAADLRPLLDCIDGFLSIERFESLSMPGKVFEAIGSIAVSSKNVSLRRRPPCDSGAWRRFCTHKDAVKSAA